MKKKKKTVNKKPWSPVFEQHLQVACEIKREKKNNFQKHRSVRKGEYHVHVSATEMETFGSEFEKTSVFKRLIVKFHIIFIGNQYLSTENHPFHTNNSSSNSSSSICTSHSSGRTWLRWLCSSTCCVSKNINMWLVWFGFGYIIISINSLTSYR